MSSKFTVGEPFLRPRQDTPLRQTPHTHSPRTDFFQRLRGLAHPDTAIIPSFGDIGTSFRHLLFWISLKPPLVKDEWCGELSPGYTVAAGCVQPWGQPAGTPRAQCSPERLPFSCGRGTGGNHIPRYRGNIRRMANTVPLKRRFLTSNHLC